MNKYIPYGHQYIDRRDIDIVVEVLRSDFITQGPKIPALENALSKLTGAKYAVVVSSGTAALHIACLAAGIKAGDEVITSPITFVASVNCVLYCGATPVFADIQDDTANIDPEQIKNKLTKRTKAIISVHFAGHPCDLEEISCIAKKHGLMVIEDAAHALGAKYKGSRIGSCKYSDMTIFSFHPVKSITTAEGGAVLTNSKAIYRKLLMLRNHGITKEKTSLINKDMGDWYYEMQALGFNYRMTDMQAALGISQLRKLGSFIEKRRAIAKYYDRVFMSHPAFDIPTERKYVHSAFHLYPIRLKRAFKHRRKGIFHTLRRQGIGVQVHYIPVYKQPYYKKIGFQNEFCPRAEDFYNREISIPLYPTLSRTQITQVTKCLLGIH